MSKYSDGKSTVDILKAQLRDAKQWAFKCEEVKKEGRNGYKKGGREGGRREGERMDRWIDVCMNE